MQEKSVGFAVIGFGGMGHHHTKLLKRLRGKFHVVGTFDIREERQALSRKEGYHAYESREALLGDPGIELVLVATPNDMHKEIVIDALEHGKNVICEKPVTMTCAGLEEMIAAAERCGCLFTVHQNRRWDPDYQTAKQIFDSNTLGRVFNIESRVHGSRGIPGDWRNQKEHGGGMLLDWGIHLLDQMLQLMGERRLLSLYTQLTFITNESCDDGFRVFCKFEDDITFSVEVMTSNFIELPRWYLLGENGSAVVKDWKRHGEIVKVSNWENRDALPIEAGVGLTKTMAPRDRKTIKRYPLPKPKCDWTGYYGMMFEALRNGGPPPVTHAEQRRLLKLVEAMFVSAGENRVIKLE